jgi:hypothetical protein
METPHIGTRNCKLSGLECFAPIPELSLPCKVTCNPDAPCYRKGCKLFSLESYRENYRESNARNLRLWRENPREYWQYIKAWIHFRKPEFFRPSVCGDMPDANYVSQWLDVCRECPDTAFMAFTKQPHLLEVKPSEKPDNFTIIASQWPGWRYYNPHDYPTSWVYGLNSPAMFEPRIPAHAFACNGQCQTCRRTPDSTVPLCWELKPGEAIKFRYSYEKDR